MASIPDNALVVVADGGKAILFRRAGDGSLRELRRVSPDALRDQGPSGARPGDQTEKQTGEASFVNHLAHLLHTMHQGGDAEAIVVIADPQTLGQLRGSMHKSVEKAVVKSLSKDYTNHSAAAIAKALED